MCAKIATSIMDRKVTYILEEIVMLAIICVGKVCYAGLMIGVGGILCKYGVQNILEL